MATITIEKPKDTYLDYDLWQEQQTWTEEDWDEYDEAQLQEEIECEIAREQIAAMPEEQRRSYESDAAFYGGLHDDNCKETFAMNKQLPKGYAVTWYVAHCWPRYVLWHEGNPIAGFKKENAKHVVAFAHASPEERKKIVSDFENAPHKEAA